ncbi:25051_t:CDS:2 [Gigaspora margarita]|uniref:25051_t:CDS:1 n=1 Tax=Gigaspora margarita TaxID=4874 RepID=A0ABM8VXD0_GIGMA|nr:25051_t:CDS:2 [Gigaspora margarita]
MFSHLSAYIYHSLSDFIFSNDISNIITESITEIDFPDPNIIPTKPTNDYNMDYHKILAYGSPINIKDINCYERFETYDRWNFSQFSSCNEDIKPLPDQSWKFHRGNYYVRCWDPDQIILNITSNNTLSPNAFFYDYFGIVFNRVFIKSPKFDIVFFSPNMSPIPRGHLVILEFSIMIKKSYESRVYGLFGFKPNNNRAYIDVSVKASSLSDSSSTLLVLKPKSNIIRFIVEKLKVSTMLSDIGGLYAAIAAIIALFFGSPRHSPCLKRHFARRYISKAGIPLVDDPRNLPPGATIEHRVAILENLLKEYYFDTSFLEVLKNTRNKYIFYDKEYKKIETEGNEEAFDTDERGNYEYSDGALIESNNANGSDSVEIV